MNSIQKIMTAWIAILFFTGCRHTLNTEPELLRWMNDPDNGLVKEKRIGELILSAKYLPAEYLAFREAGKQSNCTKDEMDSIIKSNKYSRTFLLKIGPAKNAKDVDIMYSNVESYSEYAERMTVMNFEMSEYISLIVDQKKYKPVLVNLENIYSLKNDRNLYLVFSPENEKNELLTATYFDLVFEDPFFNSGISHFKFDREDIDNIPNVEFLKTIKEL